MKISLYSVTLDKQDRKILLNDVLSVARLTYHLAIDHYNNENIIRGIRENVSSKTNILQEVDYSIYTYFFQDEVHFLEIFKFLLRVFYKCTLTFNILKKVELIIFSSF